MHIGLHVKYPLFLSNFHETLIFWTDFRRNAQISNLMKIRLVGAELLYADGQTYGHDKVNNRLSQFCKRTCISKLIAVFRY